MADDSKGEVFSNLPRSRPVRRSSKRDGSAPKPRAAAKASASDKPKRAAKPRKAASKAASKAAPKSAPKKKPAPAAETPPAGWATPEDAGGAPPGGTEIVTTAVRAVGEVAQIGAAVAGQAVKGLISRIPRP